jgi:hypothetical protein
MAKPVIDPARIIRFVTALLAPVMHFKRARSIAFAVLGAMHADRWSICAVGRTMARVRGMSPKHGIKQVDRLLSNPRFDVEAVFSATVPWLVANRERIVVSLDWTEYASDGHSRIAVNLVTRHGRATPLVWKTVETKRLKNRRNKYEDQVLYLLAEVLPPGVHVTLLADRGFGDTKLYAFLRDDLKWDFVIRFRAGIHVENAAGEYGPAADWVPSNGRVREIADALVTSSLFSIGFVCVKKRGMKDAWCLATTLQGQKERVVALYGRRFTCEENFRDEKDRRYGFGLLETRLGTTARRDRFLVIAMLATILLTLLGAAGEQLGCDLLLKPNTLSRRTHSLFRQGREYLAGCVGGFVQSIRMLFDQLLREHPREAATFAVI